MKFISTARVKGYLNETLMVCLGSTEPEATPPDARSVWCDAFRAFRLLPRLPLT